MATEQQTTADLSLAWFKSSYSGDGGGNCVEVAHRGSAVHVRDSKTDGPRLTVARSGWARFVASLTR
ncbi:DUF397 domain-containing protein [Streptomyces oryzae]|uniref:DUF397 domain-containing protein n=1 Tax=Streptomyces oryzae TaxID=1434886 RepID=A0ABS3X4P8_9ACTN|nr:DUF397 domain-containing protein [Streptomyces oryzae]MBO8190355.1 DUF397 domain-containing protein [Streptomyces oryzae]